MGAGHQTVPNSTRPAMPWEEAEEETEQEEEAICSISFYCSVHLWYDFFFFALSGVWDICWCFLVLLKVVGWYLQIVCQAESGSLKKGVHALPGGSLHDFGCGNIKAVLGRILIYIIGTSKLLLVKRSHFSGAMLFFECKRYLCKNNM